MSAPKLPGMVSWSGNIGGYWSNNQWKTGQDLGLDPYQRPFHTDPSTGTFGYGKTYGEQSYNGFPSGPPIGNYGLHRFDGKTFL